MGHHRRLRLMLGPIHDRFRLGGLEVALVLTDSQQCAFTVAGTDAAGNPASFAADQLSVTSDNPAVVTATIDPTGAGMITAVAFGAATVTITDTEPDASTVTAQVPVTVAGGESVSLAVQLGTPGPKG